MQRNDLSNRPWQQITPNDMGRAHDVPTMLNTEEAQFYFWIARAQASTPGAILDLGCFAGGTTARMAEGNRLGGGSAQIHAYDQFGASDKVKEKQLQSKGIAPFEGSDILPLTKQLLFPWAPNIHFYPGRIENSTWSGDPIALLSLDASKSAETMDLMSQIFLPSLIAGKSIIIQQDELNRIQPWITVQMQLLSECFEPLAHVPGSTVCYRCVKTPTPKMLHAARTADLTDEQMFTALEASKIRLKDLNVADRIDTQIKVLRNNPGKRTAWGMSRKNKQA